MNTDQTNPQDEAAKAADIAQYLFNNLSEDYAPDLIIKKYDVSERFLERRFKYYFDGKTPPKLLFEYRMEAAAKMLLSENDMTAAVKNVAVAVGYRTPAAFDHAFKRYYHVYPLEYVARNKGKKGDRNKQ